MPDLALTEADITELGYDDLVKLQEKFDADRAEVTRIRDDAERDAAVQRSIIQDVFNNGLTDVDGNLVTTAAELDAAVTAAQDAHAAAVVALALAVRTANAALADFDSIQPAEEAS